MRRGWFSSHTSECTHPKSLPCTQGGIGSDAGDMVGKGCKTEPCSMSWNGEGVEMVKCMGTGEAMLLGSMGVESRETMVRSGEECSQDL